MKRDILCDNFKNFICYKHLIQRNKVFERENKFSPNDKQVKLPFILIATRDSPDNEIELTFGPGDQQLNVAMKQPLKCIGDVDALMKLKFYRAPQHWLMDQIPTGCERVLSLLSEAQRKSIVL